MKWWIGVLVLGVFFAASGTGIGRSDGSPGEITCGSDVMGPGDVCEETSRGVVTDTYTYEEAVQSEKDSAEAFARTGRWVQLGLGAGLVVLAVAGIILTKRRRARRPPTTADLHFQQVARQQHPWPDAPVPSMPQWQQQPPQPPQHWQWQEPVAQPVHNYPPHAGGPPAGPAGHQWGPNQNTETPYIDRPGTTGWK